MTITTPSSSPPNLEVILSKALGIETAVSVAEEGEENEEKKSVLSDAYRQEEEKAQLLLTSPTMTAAQTVVSFAPLSHSPIKSPLQQSHQNPLLPLLKDYGNMSLPHPDLDHDRPILTSVASNLRQRVVATNNNNNLVGGGGQQQQSTPYHSLNAQNLVSNFLETAPSSRERKSSNRSFLISDITKRGYSKLERIPRIVHQFITQNYYWIRWVMLLLGIILGVLVIAPAFLAL